MPLGYSGRGTGVGMVKETTWGTAVARTDWMELVSESMRRTVARPFRPHLVGGSSFVQRDVYDAGDDYGGDMEFEAVYNAICFGHAIYAAFGSVTTTGPAGTEYAHTATLGTTLPSFTIETLKGNGTAEVGEGMKCSRFVLSMAPRDVMRVRTSWIGETSGGRASQGTPTYTSSPRPVLHSQAPSTGVTWNGTNYAKITSFELTLDNRLERRNYLGSALTTEPDFGGFRDVTLRLGLHWDGDTLWSGLTAGTSSDFTFNIAGSGDDDLEITGYNAIVEDVSDPISGPGVVTQNVTLRCRADSSDQGLKIILKNDVAGSNYDW